MDPADLLIPALAAVAALQLQAIAVTGRRGRYWLGVPLPANARVTDLIPYGQLLPHVRLMITNGGWGGVLAALSHGIPLIVVGGDIDKPEIAARVAYSGGHRPAHGNAFDWAACRCSCDRHCRSA